MTVLIWNNIIYSLSWILLAAPVLIKGERCFNDTNCKVNEFCDVDQYGVFTICKPCINCRDYHKSKSASMTFCVRSIDQCGLCLPGYELAFDVEAGVLPHCMPVPQPKVDSGLLNNSTETRNLSSKMNRSTEESTPKSAGFIAGGVALGVVALAAVIFGGVFGYKYYKEKKSMKRKSKDDERTTEFHNLQPRPTEVLTVSETKTEEDIENKQSL